MRACIALACCVLGGTIAGAGGVGHSVPGGGWAHTTVSKVEATENSAAAHACVYGAIARALDKHELATAEPHADAIAAPGNPPPHARQGSAARGRFAFR